MLDSQSFKDPVIASLVERMQTRLGRDGLLRHEAPIALESSGEGLLLAAVLGDRGENRFSTRMIVEIPPLGDVLLCSQHASEMTHVMVNVRSDFFASHHGWEYEVRLRPPSGGSGDVRHFHKWYIQHQFLLPVTDWLRGGALELSASPTRVAERGSESPSFSVELFLCSKQAIFDRLARGAIWLFSTARAGSTWLASDLLCAGERARPIDESGLGRMFAPLQWDAERFYDIAKRAPGYAESGFEYEIGKKPRAATFTPTFERNFTNMRLDNQILSTRNFRLYHRMLRETALEHVMNEYGCRDFTRTVFKCPNDAHAADFIMRAFPEASMMFLMRDGRDVMRSRFSAFGSELLAETTHSDLRRHAIAYYSHWWNFQIDIMRSAYEQHDPERRIFVKYEDLRRDTQSTVEKIFAMVGYDASPAEVRELVEATALEKFKDRGSDKPRQSGLVGGFQKAFSDDEIALMNAIMGPNLRRYGYETAS